MSLAADIARLEIQHSLNKFADRHMFLLMEEIEKNLNKRLLDKLSPVKYKPIKYWTIEEILDFLK